MKRNAWAPVIAVAIIWAAVILGMSSVLEGSPLERQVLSLVGGGAAGTIIVLGGWLRVQRRQDG
jgi:hypothetical protein